MKDILAKANVDLLAQFASSKVMLAFDFDGTLSPIVEDPSKAAMRPATRQLLSSVARLYPTVVISGRAQSDILKRVRGIPLAEVIGNHGLEPWANSGEFSSLVQTWLPLLESRLREVRGVHVENKNFSVAVHFRKSREKREAQEMILGAASELRGVRVIAGKQVINLLPRNAPLKGTALRQARDRLRQDTAVYLGDDESDEDVFALEEPGRLLGIHIGQRPTSGAAFFVRGQATIDRILKAFVAFRNPKRRSSR